MVRSISVFFVCYLGNDSISLDVASLTVANNKLSNHYGTLLDDVRGKATDYREWKGLN